MSPLPSATGPRRPVLTLLAAVLAATLGAPVSAGAVYGANGAPATPVTVVYRVSDGAGGSGDCVGAPDVITSDYSDDAAAIEAALALAAGDGTSGIALIHLCTGTFSLASGIDVSAGGDTGVVFEGESAAGSTVELAAGASGFRLFSISGVAVTFRDLTVTGADAGAVVSDSDVTVVDAAFHHNAVADDAGGAIETSGDVTVTTSEFHHNGAFGGGGAIAADTVDSTGGIFADNTVTGASYPDGSGGAINATSVVLDGGSFTRNSALWNGGAVRADSVSADGVAFASNEGGSSGGAIFAYVATVSDGTFTDNSANRGGAIDASLFDTSDDYIALNVTVSDTTFSANSAAYDGGAIYASGSQSPTTVTVSGSTFTGNSARYFGGAIDVDPYTLYGTDTRVGSLAITESVFENNSTESLGGAVASTVSATIVDSEFTANTSDDSCGALYADPSLTISGSSFTDNTAPWVGGVFGTAVAVSDSLFERNVATHEGGALEFIWNGSIVDSEFIDNVAGTAGGAIFHSVWDASRSASIVGSTFVGNEAHDAGSAVFVQAYYQTTAHITNSTFVDNAAGTDGSGDGAIATNRGLDVRNVTFSGNTGAGGIGAIVATGAVVTDSIFASSSDACSAGTLDYGGNIAVSASGSDCISAGQSRSLTLADASTLSLGTLALNAPGSTRTIAIGADSAAVGQGLGTSDGTAGGTLRCTESADPWSVASVDQRGVARPYGTDCDSGAFEYAVLAATYTLTVDAPTNGTVGSADTAIDCGSTCSADYDEDAEVTLTAAPASGYAFDHWTGDCAAETSPDCVLVMSEDRAAGAVFGLITSFTPGGSFDGSIGYGDTATLTVTIAPGPAGAAGPKGAGAAGTTPTGTVDFDDGEGWSDTCTLSGGSCSVSTAHFHAGDHTIAIHYSGDGTYAPRDDETSITVDPGVLVVTPANRSIAAMSPAPDASWYQLSVSGWVGSDDASNAAGYTPPTCGSAYTTSTLPGTIAITCGGSPDGSAGAADDYTFDYRSATLTVNSNTVSIAYTGPVVVYYSSGSGATVSLGAAIAPAIAGCPISFSLLDGASTGYGPYAATTNARGIATSAPVTLPGGAYDVTVSTAGACDAPPDFTGTLTVAPGTISRGSTGGGWYKASSASPPRVSFGYIMSVSTKTTKIGKTSVTTTSSRGQLSWVAKSGWRLKSAISYDSTDGSATWAGFTCPGGVGATGSSPKCGSFSGSGLLEVWDETLNGGLGGWKASSYGMVSFVATVYDGGSITSCRSRSNCTTTQYPDYFGLTMRAGTTPINPGAGKPPVSDPLVLWGGSIKAY